MEAPSTSRRVSPSLPWVEILVWLFILAAAIAMRLWLQHLLPVPLWSKDAGSYSYAAFRWLRTGVWETDARRGAVYSLLIAACGKLWGNFGSLILIQHAMGVTAILLSLLALRLLHGRTATVVFAACGYAYAVYGLPIFLEHMVRNETILFFCATLSLVSWLLALRSSQPHWLWITGAAAGILTATKNVWLPFPLLFAAATFWQFRTRPRAALVHVVIFAVAFAVPYFGAKIFKHRTLGPDRSDEPQEGVLLYGRTAQFTRLDGGIFPDIKAQIAPEVIAYQKEVFGNGTRPPRLNNNEILKKTVVPHLTEILRTQGKNGEDLNRLCLALAKEAIRAHPFQYGKQVLRDMAHLHLLTGAQYSAPDDAEAASQRALLMELDNPDPMIHAQESIATLTQLLGPDPARKFHHRDPHGRFAAFNNIELSAWLFDFSPVLLTSLLLPLVFWFGSPALRPWWFGAAGIWYFTMVLLSTVGRPLDRYLMPALPVMFFTLSSALMMAWNTAAARFRRAPSLPS